MSISFTPDEYKQFQDFLEKACGIVLGDNKHYLVSSRLNRLMLESNIASLLELVQKLNLSTSQQLRTKVIEAMTTNETLWFRDTYPFEVLNKIIFEDFKKDNKKNLRLWSAACSSGQEPYSISMIAEEHAAHNPGFRLDITATDISQAILSEA